MAKDERGEGEGGGGDKKWREVGVGKERGIRKRRNRRVDKDSIEIWGFRKSEEIKRTQMGRETEA